jgi:hypothetical protein
MTQAKATSSRRGCRRYSRGSSARASPDRVFAPHAVARRYMSAESITKALAAPLDEPEEVIAIAAAA